MTISPRLRDLKWVITSPGLLDAPIAPEFDTTDFDWNGLNPYSLDRFLSLKKTKKVGYYFEQLVHYWLEHVSTCQVVANQQQLGERHQIVGEIDFLYRNRASELCHLETAIKFYLHFPEDNPTGSYLIGPDPHDNFEKKMTRLLDYQLPLSEQFFPDVTRRLAFVKGRIFYHPSMSHAMDVSSQLSASHLQGTWIRSTEMNLLEERSPELRYKALPKPYWMADEQAAIDDESLMTIENVQTELSRHFKKYHRTPRLFSVLKEQSGMAFEVDRLFIVPENWPNC